MRTCLPFRPTAIAAALACIGAAAQAQPWPGETPDDVRADLYRLDHRVSLGVANVSADNRRFGSYRGLTKSGPYAWLDFDLVQREEETGTWTRLSGRNALVDGARDLRLGQERQGAWAWSLQFMQLSRREPLVVNTGLAGIGSATQVISAAATKRDVSLGVDHDIVGFGGRKFFAGDLELQFSYRQDDAVGARMFGRGTPSVMEFLTEPVDRTTRAWNVQLGRAGKMLQWTAAYEGSAYENRIPVLTSSGGNTTSFTAAWRMAMPPSNSAHRLSLAGGWRFSDDGRASARVSRSVAIQNETFDPSLTPLLAGAPTSLNGRVVTTLAYADVSTKLLPKVDLVATLRHEDRDDETPEARFLANTNPTVGGTFGTAGVSGLYKPKSLRLDKAQVEAGWSFGEGWRLVGGVEREDMRRSVPQPYRRMGWREKTDETTARLALRRSLGDSVNGSVALMSGRRGGSDYVPDTYDPNALTQQQAGLIWSDRRRERVRATVDWMPLEALSLQFVGERSSDRYDTPGRPVGPRSGDATLFAADAAWRLGDRWSASAWVSHEATDLLQDQRSDRVGAAAAGFNTLWSARIGYRTAGVGIGIKGRPHGRVDVGADIAATRDLARHDQWQTGGSGTLAVAPLPAIRYDQTTLKLFADVALSRMSGLRLQAVAERRRNDDWTWQNWTYNGAPTVAANLRNSDGTTVTNLPREFVAMLGVAYTLRWR